MPDEVYLLVYWDDCSDTVEAVCSTLVLAQAAHLEDAYPSSGPRGGKRPRPPVVTWTVSEHEPDRWTPSDHSEGAWSGYYIERHQVDSAARPPGGDSE